MRHSLLSAAAILAAFAMSAPTTAGTPIQPIRVQVLRDFTLRFDHKLGAAEARRRIETRLASLRKRFAGVATSTETWTGDVAQMRVAAFGQTANATIAVANDAVDLRVHLPLVLAPLGGNVQTFLGRLGGETFK